MYMILYPTLFKIFFALLSTSVAGAPSIFSSSPFSIDLEIHVLASSRPRSLLRLLSSLNKTLPIPSSPSTHPLSLPIIVHVDAPSSLFSSSSCVRLVRSFDYAHGTLTVVTADPSSSPRGLRDAWLSALSSISPGIIPVVFEDDVVLSPYWYRFLARAWHRYGSRTDLAGISLQRQSTIPTIPPLYDAEIVNAHDPFLFPLPGSIGFSPHPMRWREFIEWTLRLPGGLDGADVLVPGVSASTFAGSGGRRRDAWTPYFVRFCSDRSLYTLYVNFPQGKTLAAHVRERGVHFRDRRGGQDFSLFGGGGGGGDGDDLVTFNFPRRAPESYAWNGAKVGRRRHIVATATSSMLPFVRNWWHHLRRFVHGAGDSTSVLLLSLSRGLCANVPGDLPCAEAEEDETGSSRGETPSVVEFMTPSYVEAVRGKLVRFSRFFSSHRVADGETVLFSDVDVVWRADPFLAANVDFRSPSVDFLFSSDDSDPRRCRVTNTINTGVFFVRATHATRAVLRDAERNLRVGDETDQAAMQRTLVASGHPYVMLPCLTFANGAIYRRLLVEEGRMGPLRRIRDAVVAVHANWMRRSNEKIGALRSWGLWWGGSAASAVGLG